MTFLNSLHKLINSNFKMHKLNWNNKQLKKNSNRWSKTKWKLKVMVVLGENARVYEELKIVYNDYFLYFLGR